MAPLAGLREELYQEMLSHIKQTDVSVPYRDGALVVLHAHRGGPAVRHPLPQARQRRRGRMPMRRKRCCWTATSWPRGMRFSPSATPTSPTTAAGWPTRPTPRAFASTRCASRTWKPARRCRARWSAWVLWCGLRTIARCFTPSKTSSRSGSTSCGGTCLERRTRKTSLVYQDDDERFNLAAGRTRDGKYIVLESASHTTSEARVLACGRPDRQLHADCARARMSTNTRSTTATGCGLSAPTIAGATSGW